MKEKIQIEDALKHIYKCGEENLSATSDSVAGTLSLSRAAAKELLGHMTSGGLIHFKEQTYTLTEEGRQYALHVIRAHRLYETYLARETGLNEASWHVEAEIVEHKLTPEELNHMADRLGNPRYDPHGDPIPTREGLLEPVRGTPLTDWAIGEVGMVVHVEDEPESIYSEISALKISPGMRVHVLEVSNETLKLDVEGHIIQVRMVCAANIHIVPLNAEDVKRGEAVRLTSLKEGEEGAIVGITPACRGAERRRLLDLGIVPGSKIQLDYVSPFQSPAAYLVRGTLIALRREQADQILIAKN